MKKFRTYVEECFTLSVKRLEELGYLQAQEREGVGFTGYTGPSGRLKWGNGLRAKLIVRVDEMQGIPEALYIEHPRRLGSDELDQSQTITLDADAMNFGGYRVYMICPGCDTRRTKIHRPPKDRTRFQCRECHDLLYESQGRQ